MPVSEVARHEGDFVAIILDLNVSNVRMDRRKYGAGRRRSRDAKSSARESCLKFGDQEVGNHCSTTRRIVELRKQLFEAFRVLRMDRFQVLAELIEAVAVLTGEFENVGFVAETAGG